MTWSGSRHKAHRCAILAGAASLPATALPTVAEATGDDDPTEIKANNKRNCCFLPPAPELEFGFPAGPAFSQNLNI